MLGMNQMYEMLALRKHEVEEINATFTVIKIHSRTKLRLSFLLKDLNLPTHNYSIV
jgi:hypothetical protein